MTRFYRATYLLILLTMFSTLTRAEEETIDVEFLEWLGQVSEVEDLGVDINELLKAQELQAQRDSDEDSSK